MTRNEKEELLAKIWDMPKPKDGSNYWQGVDDVADLISNMPITEREKGGWIPVTERLPSAFEGMTNGETLLAVYPNAEIEICEQYNTVRVWFAIDKDHHFKDISFGLEWWNAPYKAESEE